MNSFKQASHPGILLLASLQQKSFPRYAEKALVHSRGATPGTLLQQVQDQPGQAGLTDTPLALRSA